MRKSKKDAAAIIAEERESISRFNSKWKMPFDWWFTLGITSDQRLKERGWTRDTLEDFNKDFEAWRRATNALVKRSQEAFKGDHPKSDSSSKLNGGFFRRTICHAERRLARRAANGPPRSAPVDPRD
jgi:hypothetical protein